MNFSHVVGSYKNNSSYSSVNRSFQNNRAADDIIFTIAGKYTRGTQAVLNVFIALANKYEHIQVTIDKLAKLSGYSPITVKRAIRILVKDKFIRIYRFGGPALYVIADEFRYKCIREQLYQILSATIQIPFNDYKIHKENETAIICNIYIHEKQIRCSCEGVSYKHDLEEFSSRYFMRVTNTSDIARFGSTMEANTVDSYIKPYVEAIKDIPLNFGERFMLSKYPEAVVNKALWILRNNKNATYTFSYLDGICRRISSNNTNGGKFKRRFDIQSNVAGDLHAIDLEIEAQEKSLMAFAAARNLVATHTSGSALHDQTVRHAMGIRSKTQAGIEELITLSRMGKSVREFIDEIVDINQWNPIDSVAEIDEMIETYDAMQADISWSKDAVFPIDDF